MRARATQLNSSGMMMKKESIPAEGGLVKVEAIDENTVYLTPIN
jgi:hypothetical protein